MKDYVKDYLLELCCSYTVISVAGAIANAVLGTQTNNANVILMFTFCAIAVFVLSLHKLLSELSPLMMILIQFVVSFGLCMLVVFIISFIEPVTPRGWFEFIRSFVIIYVLGAGYYYFRLFRDTKKQNDLIAELRQKKEK